MTAAAVEQMVTEMIRTQQPGVELGTRLLHRTFRAQDMASRMEDGPLKSAVIQAAGALQDWSRCDCNICERMTATGELQNERARGGMAVVDLEAELTRLGCACGLSVIKVWRGYTIGFISAVYAN